MDRIGVMTGGGHVSCFHDGLIGMFNESAGRYEIFGAIDGYKGANEGSYVQLRQTYLVPHKAGSLLGSTRHRADGELLRTNMQKWDLKALVVMGGDDHLGEAAVLYERFGVPVVGWPKTMDGDLNSRVSLGEHTANSVGIEKLRKGYAHAVTNGKPVFYVMFGRDTDKTSATVGTWGGADIIIPAEHEYRIGDVARMVRDAYERNGDEFPVRINGYKHRKPFAIVAVSEGAQIEELKKHLNPDQIDDYGHPKLNPHRLAVALEEEFRKADPKLPVSFDIITYDMRNADPTPLDARLAEEAGRECVRMIDDGAYGQSAVVTHDLRISRAPLHVVAEKQYMKPTGHMDYKRMATTPYFAEDYGPIYGRQPTKEELVNGLWLPEETSLLVA
ncbi:MAG: 6-phosphofructokinase [Candidatus Aenigmarchaeota archaeon]|nr:6-phosphofructokinase [Candidatus Aenigmarchaeota archaeon]